MNRVIRTILRGFMWVMILLLLCSLVLGLLIRQPAVQSALGKYAAAYLSEELGTEVKIRSLFLSSLKDARLTGFFVADFHGDTLIYFEQLKVKGVKLDREERDLHFDLVELKDARTKLRKYADQEVTDLRQLLDKLTSAKDSTQQAPFRISADEVFIRSHHFTFENDHLPRRPVGAVDIAHLDVDHQELVATDLLILGDSVSARIASLILHERSGFHLDPLSAKATVSQSGIILEEMDLNTGSTHLHGQLGLHTDSLVDFSDFVHRVQLRLQLDSSRIDFQDIAYFAQELKNEHVVLDISGRIRGSVSDLKGRGLAIRGGQRTSFNGDVDLVGLPNAQDLFAMVDVASLSTDHDDLMSLGISGLKRDGRSIIPKELQQLGTVRFNGNFTGFMHSFTAYGAFNTPAGDLNTDVSFTRPSKNAPAELSGYLSTKGIQVDRILQGEAIGMVAGTMKLDAIGTSVNDLKAELNGHLTQLEIQGQSLGNIELRGKLEKNLFNGELQSRDPNLELDFRGLADLRGQWPIVDFEAMLYHIDPARFIDLGMEGPTSLSMRIKADGVLAPDSLKGIVQLNDVLFCENDREHHLGNVDLRSDRLSGVSVLELLTDMADLTVEGEILPTQVPRSITNSIKSLFPALQEDLENDLPIQDFRAHLVVKDASPILELVAPGLKISKGSELWLTHRTSDNELDLKLVAGRIDHKNLHLDSLRADLDRTAEIMVFRVNADRGSIGDSLYMIAPDLSGQTYQDRIDMGLGWKGSSHGTTGTLSMQANVIGPRSFEIDLLPSQIFLGRGVWSVEETARIRVDSSDVQFNRLELKNEKQFISLDGRISKDPEASLAFVIRGFRLENMNVFHDGPNWTGAMEGDGRLSKAYEDMTVYSYVCIDSLAVNKERIGDVRFAADWNERRKRIDLNGTVERDQVRAVDLQGWIKPGPDNEVALELDLDRFSLRFLDPYLPTGISNVQGTITGQVFVDGSFIDPLVNGEVMLDNAEIKIDYLNTTYNFSHLVRIYPDMFAADLIRLTDEEGNRGTAIVTLIHESFKDFNYDISVEMERMLVLNTVDHEGALYFGKAYGTGDLMVSGFGPDIRIDVDARTEAGTSLSFPLSNSTEVTAFDFVEFVSSDSILAPSAINDLNAGVTLNMSVDVTDDAWFELIFDPTVGDVVKGRGRGNVELEIQPGGDLSMMGHIDVVEGEYLFTLRNLVNKRFSIETGGGITWYGDPFNAQLDLSAVYRLRASLYDVMYDRSDAYRKRVPVEVVMGLRENLINPEINFQVRLPSVDENVRTQVASVLSTEQELNRQVFSLMVLNRFTAPPASAADAAAGSGALSGAGATGSELLSNQVSNWLSQFSNDLDLGVNYRPGDNVTQDEFEVAVSTQLFNERLLVSSNVGVSYGDRTGAQSNTLIGDFQLEYLLSKDGRLRLKAFSESNDRNLNQVQQAATTQGVGVGFRQEFNTFGGLWNNIKDSFKPKAEKAPPEE